MSTATIFHCYCTGVTQKRVLRAMAEKNAKTFDEVRRASGACTGCQSCRCELERLLAAVADGTIELSGAPASRPASRSASPSNAGLEAGAP